MTIVTWILLYLNLCVLVHYSLDLILRSIYSPRCYVHQTVGCTNLYAHRSVWDDLFPNQESFKSFRMTHRKWYLIPVFVIVIISLDIILVFTVHLFCFCESLVRDLFPLFSWDVHPFLMYFLSILHQPFVTVYFKKYSSS